MHFRLTSAPAAFDRGESINDARPTRAFGSAPDRSIDAFLGEKRQVARGLAGTAAGATMLTSDLRMHPRIP